MALLSTVIGRGVAASKPASPATGYQYFSTDTGRMERYSGSAWEEIDAPAILFKFSTTTTDADPGAGTLRFNNGTPASVTKIFVDDTCLTSGADLGTAYAGAAGAYCLIQDITDTAKYLLVTLDTVTDDTGYFDIAVTVKASGTLPADGALLSFTIIGGGGGSTLTEDQELVKRQFTRGMIRMLHRQQFQGTAFDGDGGIQGGVASDVDLTQAAPTFTLWSGGAATLAERYYPKYEYTTITTTSNWSKWQPQATGTAAYYTPTGPMIWAHDWCFADSQGNETNRDYLMLLWGYAGSTVTDANARGWLDGTAHGNSTTNNTLGAAGILMMSGAASAIFRTSDGTASEDTTITGVDLFDGAWHDLAIYHDGAGNWYAIVDGTIYGPHNTNVPNRAGTLTGPDGMVPLGPGLSNDASSAPSGTCGYATTYNFMACLPAGGEGQDLLDAVGDM